MRRKLSDEQIGALLKIIEDWPTFIANLLERNAITENGVDVGTIVQEFDRLLSEHSEEIQALGLPANFEPDEDELRSLGEMFQLFMPDTTMLEMLESLLADAINHDHAAAIDVCTDFVRDLLKNPNPTPRIIRSTPSASLARSFGFQPMRRGETAEDHAEERAHLRAIAPQMIRMAANVFEPTTYYRYELPKYLNGFVSLVEGDYRRVLTVIYALQTIIAGNPLTYRVARGVAFSDKVVAIRAAGHTSVVESFENMHHARNALTHLTYEIEYVEGIATNINFRDDYNSKKGAWGWEKSFRLSEFLGLFHRLNWVNQYAVAAPANGAARDLREALSKHWDPEFHESRVALDPAPKPSDG